jgi:two-component system, sensor histidine kinase and response regulator
MKKNILIVEDEHDLAELLSYHLHKVNYQTMIARNGEEAIDAVQNHSFDAVLLDIMLPELNGWEVCRILRESTKGTSLPIIMVSALSDEEARIRGLSLGADDYVSKPYSMKELVLKLGKQMDRLQTITQMKAREQEQDMIVRYMVHELRNSLTMIGGYSSLALQKDDTNKFMRTIHAAAIHAESLLQDASLLSRLEKGHEGLSIEPVAIGSLVNEAIDFLRDTARSSNIKIIFENNTTSFVQGNGTAIRQILINLVSNAVKYNRKGGTVGITFDTRNDRVNISIRDEGYGIAKAEIGHIFDKFYRAAGSERIKGAGLGLYIVRLLTKAIGGVVTVVSRPGHGSAFTVSFIKANAATHQITRDVGVSMGQGVRTNS